MTKSTQVRLTRAERREQLLDVTKRIVGEHGPHSVSIDRVAREAGITRPIVYEHFSDLGGLLHALLDREGARALAQLGEFMPRARAGAGAGAGAVACAGGDELADVLLAALSGYLAAVRADPVTWRLVLTPPEGAPEFMRTRVEQARAAVVAELAALISAAYAPDAGERSPDPELTASSMSALADHWARLMLTEPQRFDAERILAHARWALGRGTPP